MTESLRTEAGNMPGRESGFAQPISVTGLIDFVLDRRGDIVLGASGAVAVAVALVLASGSSYTSRVAFVTEGSTRSSVASLAGQFGVAIPLSNPTDSPQFYADLIHSRELLLKLLSDTLTIEQHNGRPQTILELIGIRGSGPVAEDRGVRRLSRQIVASVTRTTGIVRIEVKSRSADLSRAIAERLVAAAHAFNQQSRRTQAGEERRFVERRLDESRRLLREAENRLRDFLQANRQYQGSPTLLFEYQRLTRDIALQQQLYTSLSISYEEVRAREVRDTPVITVVDHANRPATRDSRHLGLIALLALIVGGFAGAVARDVTRIGVTLIRPKRLRYA